MNSNSPTRRAFLSGAAAAALASRPLWAAPASSDAFTLVSRTDRARILSSANHFLREPPITITSSHSPRSQGGLHDYFSEGDYWWPDPQHPGGPYIRRDGFSDPQNFNSHREALIRLSLIAPALAAAWRLTRKPAYATHLLLHLNAWFVDPATRVNPNLQYAQAIFGVTPGRGTGIIDTLQLVDVARALRTMEAAHGFTDAQLDPIRAWFADYSHWMLDSKNGKEEETARNNHGTCWVLQMAEFSQFARLHDLTSLCLDRFKTIIVPNQIAANGSLPLELARTKPYSYSLFDMDVLSGICQSLSTPASGSDGSLWNFRGPNGKGVGDVVSFLFPFIKDKSRWPFAKDVEYFDDLPARRPSLLFAGIALHRPDFIDLWKHLNPDPTVPEIIRNFPIRQPLLWVDPLLAS